MARLPIPGGDKDQWGSVLNDFLSTSHHGDGTLKAVANVFNVADYGAVGNGTTNDTAAIQAALTAAANAGGGTVFVPAATFLVNPGTGVSLGNNVTLMGTGRGSVLKVPSGANTTGNLVRIESKTNVTVANIMLEGNRSNQTSGTNYGLYVASSDDCKVTQVWTENFTGVGMQVYDCDGVTVSGCTSSGNAYHGFECEQNRGCIWQGNRGYSNDRHGIFISPGEVGGSGSKGNSIIANSFDSNSQYGIAVGVAAAPGSELLSSGNIITGNSVRNNTQYGISLYYQDGNIVTGNLVEQNGFFGIYGYKTRSNTITGNRLHNNSQSSNNAYDEIMFEGNTDGRASRDNLVADNVIVIDGATKARYAINEATSSDGPNTVTYNAIPSAGASGTLNIQNTSSQVTSPAGVQQVRGGQSIGGSNAGIDNAFNLLRLYSNLPNSEVQVVSSSAYPISFWVNGSNTFRIEGDGSVVVNNNFLRVATSKTPASASAAGTAGDIAWDANFIYVCVATNTWKRVGISTW